MRKKAVFPVRICRDCGSEFAPRGASQIFCASCSKSRDVARKRLFYERTNPDRKPKCKSSEVCSVCGSPFSSHFNGLPYCNVHYLRLYNHGTTDVIKRKSTNTFSINGDIVEIVTRRGAKITVDVSDFELVNRHSWCIRNGYAVANISGKVTPLQRFLLNAPKGKVVDHINGNPLDNRRSNLRLCTQRDNARNCCPSRSNKLGVLGVSRAPKGKFRARILVDGKEYRLGVFDTIEEAKLARQNAEIAFFGNFAPSICRNHES